MLRRLEVFKLHLVPSGVLYPHINPLIGPGVVVNPATLIRELDALIARGVDISLDIVGPTIGLIGDEERAAIEAEAQAAYARAELVVRDESPAIPVSYGRSDALVRKGLLGAGDSGNGILRFAGMAWAP